MRASSGRSASASCKRRQPGLEAQIANLADEIAYNNHDVDDGLRAELIEISDLMDVRLFRRQYDVVDRPSTPASENGDSCTKSSAG